MLFVITEGMGRGDCTLLLRGEETGRPVVRTRTADIFYCRFAVHIVRTAGGSPKLLREEIWFNYYHVT